MNMYLDFDQKSSGFKDSLKEAMLRDPLDQLPLDEISSMISSQLFDLCDPELFQTETLTNSEVASSSNNNYCYEDNSSNYNITYNDTNNNTNTNNNNNLYALLDCQDEIIDNDISASIDFSSEQLDFSSVLPQYHQHDPFMGHSVALPPVLEEECSSSSIIMPSSSFLRINNNIVPNSSFSSSFVDMASYFPGNIMTNALFSDVHSHELDYQGDNGGIYCPDSVQRLLNSGDLQAFNGESQQIVNGEGTCTTPLGSEILNLEESAFKVGKLSVEERKEKINRYMKKRNQRNFNKKIKYACRKTLADSRPRVRGRFAKNEEFGDHRHTSVTHDDAYDEDIVRVKEEHEMLDSSDIFAHISGVNSFKCNYSIQSWI